MRAVLCALLFVLSAQLLTAQTNSSSTGQSVSSSSTGQSTGQSSSSNQSFTQTSSTGSLVNQTSTGQSVIASSSTGAGNNGTVILSSSSSSSSPFNGSMSSSSSLNNGSFFASSSSSAADPCFECMPMVYCSAFDEWSIPQTWPKFKIHSSGDIDYDLQQCSRRHTDIDEITSVIPGFDSDCSLQMLNFSCSYFSNRTRQASCQYYTDERYTADCWRAVSCLNQTDLDYVNSTGFCTNMDAFLNRPIVLRSSSSSTGEDGSEEDGPNSAAQIGGLLVVVIVSSIMVMAM